ncbi:N-acetylglucosamine kinase [Glycomyces tenuis]|uniref:N-acetylglucosamine kinase n=1 Tax=Glycomyces tenuis TaxID=58116 RepID=UPI000425C8B6|nr:BadF/BadG/BcrA/BcrD ATPase family protein [Glycomyces tenuis]
MHPPLFLGIDAGGTHTRALLADSDGVVVGTGGSGPANVVGVESDTALRRMAEAAAAALGSIGPEAVDAVCAGAAGMLSLPGAGGHFGEQLRAALGVGAPVSFVSDAVTAFAAGTDEPDGTVVVAGTGAVALAVRGHTEVAGRSDGYGWLLGDAGSGFWLGREAVAATLRHLDGHGPGGWMVQAVIASVGAPNRTSAAIVGRCMAESPARLARFAPLVFDAAEGGDAQARDLVDKAVDHLAATAAAVAERGRPITLAGSLLTKTAVVSQRLGKRLAEDFPGTPVLTAAEPVRGAAWLAGRGFAPDAAARRELHRRLTEQVLYR